MGGSAQYPTVEILSRSWYFLYDAALHLSRVAATLDAIGEAFLSLPVGGMSPSQDRCNDSSPEMAPSAILVDKTQKDSPFAPIGYPDVYRRRSTQNA